MIKVVIGPNEDINRAISRFKRKCERAGLLKEVKKNSFFTKPSEKRRLQRDKAIRRLSKLREQFEA